VLLHSVKLAEDSEAATPVPSLHGCNYINTMLQSLNCAYTKAVAAPIRRSDRSVITNNERYVKGAPSIQNIVDIFEGMWASKLPLDVQCEGSAELFYDCRIIRWNEIAPVEGKKILELGPLEGGHSYMLEQLGASSVTSVEANKMAFLRCLVVKDIFKLQTNFLLGDFAEYLKNCSEAYDIVLACGVLYHMPDPVQLIKDISKVTNTIFLWTHYYSEKRVDRQHFFEKDGPFILHSEYKAHKHYYQNSDDFPEFCGGNRDYASWLERDALLKLLKDCGFEDIVIINDDNDDHQNGANITLLARKADVKDEPEKKNEPVLSNTMDALDTQRAAQYKELCVEIERKEAYYQSLCAEKEEQYQSFINSTSWKITAPLRQIARFFKRS